MEVERIEYVRKNRRSKGKKRGVLFCGVHPQDAQSVIVGFSLCNSIDRFDYVDGIRIPGFGLAIAKKRALKWSDYTDYFIQNSFTEGMINDEFTDLILYINSDPENIQVVEIPPSIVDRLKTFIERCKRYYKDKEFPVWVENFEHEKEYNKDRLDNFIVDHSCYREEVFVHYEDDMDNL